MNLSSDLISQFVKVTNDTKDDKNETVIYGTIKKVSNTLYVQPDWSDQLIPISKYEVNDDGKIETITYINSSAADLKEAREGDRVTLMIKNHVVTLTGNLSSPAASTDDSRLKIGEEVYERVSEIEVDNVKINERIDASEANVNKVVADNVSIKEQLTAAEGKIGDLETENVSVKEQLDAAEGDIKILKSDTVTTKELEANYAKIEDLNVTNEKVYNLDATFAEFKDATAEKLTAHDAVIDNLDATYAKISRMEVAEGKIDDLEAKTADIDTLEADVAKIDNLIFDGATGNTMHANFANAVIALLGNAWIKSAMIDSVAANKITGDIVITEDLEVISEDGHIVIQNGVIQVLDDDKNVRVQLGKDASNNYSITIWDADGNKMFDAGGITADAIKSDIIVDNMVSATADIDASKLNISSLFDVINNDGTKTIKAAKIHLDAEGRSLEAGFNSLTTEVDGLQNEVSSQGSRLEIVEDKITSEVWKQDIDTTKNELNEEINTLSTEHSTLEQTVDGISATVASHTSQLTDKAEKSEVTAVTNKVAEVETSLEGFKTTVSNTYLTKTEFDDLEIGGRNLIAVEDLTEETYGINFSGASTKEFTASAWVGTAMNNAKIKAKLESGETYTLSCELEIISLPEVSNNGIYDANVAFYFYSVATNYDLMLNATLVDGEHGYLGAKYVMNKTFIMPEIQDDTRLVMYTTLYRLSDGGPGDPATVKVTNLKLEKGNKPTDWTPAPEDTDNAIVDSSDQVRQEMVEQNAAIVASCSEIIMSALESYVQTSDHNEFKETVESQLKLLSDQMTLNFTTTTERLESVNGELQEQLNTITTYFTFEVDGLTIGRTDSPYKIVQSNDRYSMYANGIEVLWIDAETREVHTPELTITDRFRMLGYQVEKDADENVNWEFLDIISGGSGGGSLPRLDAPTINVYPEMGEFAVSHASGEDLNFSMYVDGSLVLSNALSGTYSFSDIILDPVDTTTYELTATVHKDGYETSPQSDPVAITYYGGTWVEGNGESTGEPDYYYDDVDGWYPYDPEFYSFYTWSGECPYCGTVLCGSVEYIQSTEYCPHCGQEIYLSDGDIQPGAS